MSQESFVAGVIGGVIVALIALFLEYGWFRRQSPALPAFPKVQIVVFFIIKWSVVVSMLAFVLDQRVALANQGALAVLLLFLPMAALAVGAWLLNRYGHPHS